MNKLVCNYAPLRFLPYRETGEFVNLGVAIQCPQTDFFGFRLVTARRSGRVCHFFPELDREIFTKAVRNISQELDRAQNRHRLLPTLEHVDQKTANQRVLEFRELVRKREGLIHFGDTGLVLHANPEQALNELFERFVERQFAQKKEYQEIVMRQRLASCLKEWKLDHYYRHNEVIGDMEFKVPMPFVYFQGQTPTRVIKPFDLDKAETTEIYDHGGLWVNRIARLKERKQLPKETFFTVRLPREKTHSKAANEIVNELEHIGVTTIDYKDENKIFQKVSEGLTAGLRC